MSPVKKVSNTTNAGSLLAYSAVKRDLKRIHNMFSLIHEFSMKFLVCFDRFKIHLMSGSCHLDRAPNLKIGVECQIFVIVIFFNC